MPQQSEELLSQPEEALTEYAVALLARATAAEARCRALEAELAETKEYLGRATELLLHSPGVSVPGPGSSVPAGEASPESPRSSIVSPSVESSGVSSSAPRGAEVTACGAGPGAPEPDEHAAPAPARSEPGRRRSSGAKRTNRWILLVSALVGGTLSAIWNSCARYSGKNQQQQYATQAQGPASATAPLRPVARPTQFTTSPAPRESVR